MTLLLAVILSTNLTPGVVRPLTQQQVCETKWGTDRRHVTEAMRKEVFRRYGIPWADRGLYEVDHKIPRELGGADDVRNLQPQLWDEARRKDVVENRLHQIVCGRLPMVPVLSLHEAQERIRKNWRTALIFVGKGQ